MGRFIVSPGYDRFFFIFSPLWALGLGALGSLTPLSVERFALYGKSESAITLFSGVFTMAHLVIVFFRSHGNPQIFRLYPKRFVIVPLLLFATMMISSWFLVFIFVLAVWWDVYHSSLQTFGFGRIYDAKAGNAPETGRALDRGLNLLLYAGPILGGATLVEHAKHFRKFEEVGTVFFSAIPAELGRYHRALAVTLLVGGAIYLFYYLWKYRRLAESGYRVSREKVWLFAATGACSIYAWGFNSFGQAFFIMNFFHALQYFALVWHTEKIRLRSPFILIALGFSYGIWAKFYGESSHAAFSLLLTVSIMHFWYDGFIWSVQKKQIA